MDHQKAIAEAATSLLQAIQAARAAGYRVIFADHTLTAIPVSETRRTVQAEPAPEPPVPIIGRASRA